MRTHEMTESGFLRELQPDEVVTNLIGVINREVNSRYPSPVELRKITAQLLDAWRVCQSWMNGDDSGETGIYDDGLPF